MGKVDTGIIDIYGKHGNTIIVKSRKRKKKYTRSFVAKGTKQHEPALKKQYTRTAALNNLAGSLNIEFKEFLRNYRRTDLYQYMLRCFRRADSMNRFVLLSQLKDAELSPDHPLYEHSTPKLDFNISSEKISCQVSIDRHPIHMKTDFNSWYFDILFLQWEPGKDVPDPSRKLSEWVSLADQVPLFEFEFPRLEKTREWMLVLRLRWGCNKFLLSHVSASSAQVVEVYSLNPQDHVLLEEATNQMNLKRMKKLLGEKEVVEGERVRAKGV